jgi:hypothetical protein
MVMAQTRKLLVLLATLSVLMLTLAACGGVSDTTIPAPPGGTVVDPKGSDLNSTLVSTIQPNLDTSLKAQNISLEKQDAYATSSSVTDVANFYKTEMKNRGWNLDASNEQSSAGQSVIVFDSGDKAAMIMIVDASQLPGGNGTLVLTANAKKN